jgi:hypothetical protein
LATNFSVALLTFAIGIATNFYLAPLPTSPTPTPPKDTTASREVNYDTAEIGRVKRHEASLVDANQKIRTPATE